MNITKRHPEETKRRFPQASVKEIGMTSEQLAWMIRRHAIEMTHISHGSHIGSVMSVADIVAVLYSDILQIDPEKPQREDRDRFLLGKGHASAAVYAALAEKGFFPTEELKTFYQNGSRLIGHVSHKVSGIEFSTGSLGHALSAAAGMAYAGKKDGKRFRVFTVLGDGECNEGSVWEAAAFASHFRLNNLIAIIDYNHMQSLDFSENTLLVEDMAARWKAFGWNTVEINGNDHDELRESFGAAEILRAQKDHRPTVIIANTIKGYGVSFMQNDILWHYRFPHDGWEYDQAVTELHRCKPEGVQDPYTPEGIWNPQEIRPEDDVGNDHTCTKTWRSDYPEQMRRFEAAPASGERVHCIEDRE